MASFSSSSSPITKFKFLLGAFLLLAGIASAQLSSSNFYGTSCPNALSVIKSAVTTAVSNEARMGASLLRLHFHDCFVNGCDASVLLDGGEKNAPANANSLRGFEVIDNIKSQLETSCGGVVSCADILAVAARDSVVALGGQGWEVRLGRRDSATAGSVSDVNNNIPSPALSLSALITSFSNKGFTAKEMVALSGSHTIGQARCTSFSTRINNETNIDASFKTSTQAKCSNSNNFVALDVTSPNAFDNAYFTNLVGLKGLLHSDQQLFSGGSTDAQVRAYSSNPVSFMTDFGNAMIKMGNLSPLAGTNGQIRTNCRKAN